MFLGFFYYMRSHGLPVSLHEYLVMLEGLQVGVAALSVEDFYFWCRTVFVKQEGMLDRFDRIFGAYFEGLEYIEPDYLSDIPEEWLRKNMERMLTEEERALIEAMGGPEKLYERFKELLEKQKERHEGGNTWIGTGGTSPFGAYGYNPEGFRVGQQGSRHRKAIKVWDKRDFANLDDDVELETRNMKLALKRLRMFTREGVPDELDLDTTIRNTTRNAGILDIHMIPSKQNRVKVLLLMDIGGSMDDHVEVCSRMFSAAKHEFKHMEYYYFHNCVYETLWKDNRRRNERVPTLEVLHKYNKDYKVIFIGDAAMSPYEIISAGGSVEHYNDEAGIVWLQRLKDYFPYMAWINPNPERGWNYFQSTGIIREFMDYRMFPMTLAGLTHTIKALKDSQYKYQPDKKAG